MKRTKKQMLMIAAIVLVVAIAIGGVALWLRNEKLEQIQNEALAELERNVGQYDEQSIVLYETSKAKAEELAKLYGAKLRITEDGRFATLTLPEGTTIRDVYAMEESRKHISDMAADYQVSTSELEEEEVSGERLPQRPQYSVADEDYELQTYLDYLNMGDVWNQYTGSGVTVAVIDTGIDTDHPEFAGRISEYSYNATEDKIVKDWLLEDGSYDWSLIEDEQGHGTAVTGVIAANMNSGNVVGIAPDAEIIVIKAECDANGTFYRTSDLVFGIYYAIERDVHVINMSFGVVGSNPFGAATQLAYDSDIICVAAAGNSATSALTYPAADEHTIGVGALSGWELAEYSNYGENVNICAPGTTYTTLMDGAYGNMTGTSLASPIVAGAMALLLQNNPYTTYDAVTEILYAACYDLGDLGRDWYYGFGALDLSALLLEERGTIHYEMLTDEVENLEGLYIQGHTLQELPEPERLYAVFDGWYYDDTFTQEYNYYEDEFHGYEVTLYAKWVNEEDGVPYTYVVLDDGTVEIRSYTGHRKYITIPEKIEGKLVSSIGDFAFDGQNRLREVTLPAGLRHIGLYAFQNCANLVSIQIPENVTDIEAYAFSGNVRLSTVAFLGNSKLETIGDFAFESCGSLERIELPASLVRINGAAFYGATVLYHIGVQNGNTAFQSREGVLYNLNGDTLVAFPAAWGTSYTLPAETVIIGDYAVAFSNIRTIDLLNVKSIGEYAFCASALTQVNIPDSVIQMGKCAFSFCGDLSAVTLGYGLTEIPMSAFSYCTSLTQITIPNCIAILNGGAFANAGLKEVIFEANSVLSKIGDRAFYDCQLSSITIPASVERIDEAAFSGNLAGNPLVQVLFEKNSALQVIGESAFEKCWLLQNIELPAALQKISEFAFRSSGLTAVTVPANVTNLGSGAFSLCSDLTAVMIAEGNSVYHDVDGVVYTLDNITIHTYPAGKTEEIYAIDETTQIVAPWAFAGAENLYWVNLPEGLTQISEYGFVYCSNLQRIHIPNDVLQIGRFAFAYDWNLHIVTFNRAARLPRLSYGAFAYSGLDSFCVPASVSTMAQGVFEGCCNLTQIIFEEGSKLESISAYMFDGCENLTSIEFEQGSALTSIQAHGLEGMDNLTYIDFGDAKLTNIDNFAFRFCARLSELNLPETVTNIGRYAFYGCKNLPELTIPANVEHIGSYAFLGTNDLDLYFTNENLPAYLDENWDHDIRGYYTGVSEVAEMGDYRYAVLPSGGIGILEYLGTEEHIDLTQVDLGGPITVIGGSAFEDSTVKTIVLPETLTAIQAEAFRYTALEGIHIPANVTFIGREAFAYTDIQSLIFADHAQIAVIEQYAFQETQALTAVTLPASVTTLGTGVFQGSGLQSVVFQQGIALEEIPQNAFAATKLTAVVLPDSVTLVNHNAFNNVQTLKSVAFGNNEGIRLMSNAFYHTGLTSLHIPANVTYIGEYCFVALGNLQSFSVDENNPNYKAEDGLLMTKSGRKLIAVPAGREGTLTVPLCVEEIGFGAFEESKLNQVLFHPDANILTFGYRAFFKANNITTITIPESVVSIDYYAFAYCENLKEVIFVEDNQLKGIYEGAFCGDINLETIILPESIVEISDFAFYGCSKITKLPVADTQNLKGIYDYAFAYTGLGGEFTTPESLWDIGNYAFLGCKFTKLTIPDTNKKDLIIGIGAFEDCNSLEEITLPFLGASFEDEKISWFGYIFGAGGYESNNLYLPNSLKTVTITEGIQSLYTGAFYDVDTPQWLYLPDSITTIWPDAFVDTGANFELHSPISLEFIYENSWLYRGFFENSNICGELTLADGLDRVPVLMFSDCEQLKKVNLPDSVTVIESFAFNGTTMMTIDLPKNLTTIEGAAFQSAKLTTITLPESLETIEKYAFNGCMRLRTVINHSALDITPGSENHGSVAWSAYTVISSNGDVLTKDDGIIRLETKDGFLFELRDDQYVLVEYVGTEDVVTLPLQVKGQSYTIERFRGANHVIIPGEMKTLNGWAFQDSDILTVQFCEGITEIGYGAFYGAYNLSAVILPESLTVIDNEAFYMCSSLKSIHIPENVKIIGQNAFASCTALQMTVDAGNAYFTELGGVIYDKAVTEMIHAPYDLVEIEIPNTVTHFSLQAHTNLRKVSFEVGSALTELPRNAFAACNALETVVLPDGIQRINAGAFAQCFNLKEVNIPDSVCDIENNPFRWSGIAKLIMSEEHPHFTLIDGALYNKSVTKLVAVLTGVTDLMIPATVTTVGPEACAEHQQLTKVDFEEGSQLVEIEHSAFACTLYSVTLPENLATIAGNAFWNVHVIYNRSQLELTFGSGVAWGTKKIVEADGTVRYNLPEDSFMTDDGFVFTIIDGQYAMIEYLGDQDTVTLPLEVNGQPYILYEVKGVTNVIIPEGFTRIDGNAFWCCTTLQSVVIPDTVVAIGSGAFQGCTALRSVVIPESVEYLMGSTFWGCTNLTEITLPDGIYINEYDFDNTAYVNNPANWIDGCCYIGKHLVLVDTNAKRIIVREDTANAAYSAFNGAYQLEYLDLGNLTNVRLPDSQNLVTLVLGKTPEYMVEGFFDSVPLTLKNVVLKNGFVPTEWAFLNLTGVTIYVEESEQDTQWDVNFSGWSQDCRVTYGDNWIWVSFYAADGSLISNEPIRTSQVVRRPAYELIANMDGYAFLGWDLDGDGIADSVPATSVVDINAHALVERICDHVYSSVEILPTCTADGAMIHTCTICGDIFTEVILATGHEEVIDAAVAPTCTENGLTEGCHCDTCGEKLVEQQVILATGHAYEMVVTEPTCTKAGYTTCTCATCGDSYVTDEVAAFGHHYVDGVCEHCGAPEALLGDVNGDGRVNARDARLLLRYAAGLADENEIVLDAADYNGDGRVNARDARALLRYAAGLD